MSTRLLITTVAAQSLLLGACHSSDVTADTGSQAFDAAGPWSCLDQPPQITTANPVAITFKIFDGVDQLTTAGSTGGSDLTVISFSSLPGITVEACAPLDPMCAQPLAPPEISDDAGEGTVTVPDDFSGFFKFSGAGYVVSNIYPGPLLADALTFAPPVGMVPPQSGAALAQVIGETADLDAGASVGNAFFEIFDCFDRHAEGVSFAMSVDAGPTTVQYYLNNGLPTRTATQTDSLGGGGVVNVPIGLLTITATLAETNQTLGSIRVNIVAGAETFAWVRARTH